MLLAGATLAAACGGDRADEPQVPGTTTSELAPGEAPAPPPDTQPGGAPATGPGPGPDAAPPGPGPAPTVVEPGGSPPAPAPIEVGPVGSLAATYLRPDASSTIVLEVRSQDGAAPRRAVLDRVAGVLRQVSGKSVELVGGATVGGGSRSWSADELRAVADGGAAQVAGRPVLRLLFLHGGFAENERAVGVAVRGDVAAVFADRVDEAAGMLGDRAAVEDAVTLHEVGHLLGLVDLVLGSGRADPEHPGHSPNRGSVMYYAVESTLLGSVLDGGPPRDFDADDLAELAAIRGG